MAKKSFNEKLRGPSDLPKIEDLSPNPDSMKRLGGRFMLIASPLQYNEIMEEIPEGKVITADRIRKFLAQKAGADVTCPLTAGIFINICANASEEREDNKIPYWRTLKTGGELNPKYPQGVEGQKKRLESEGHTIVKKGSRFFVEDYEKSLVDIKK
ncbi:MAG: MGMT family protein [Gallicola sp.]|nr:MGMT family protein [Gallicola sp.]